MNVRPTLKLLEGYSEVQYSSKSHEEVRTEETPASPLTDRLLASEEPSIASFAHNICSRQPSLATLFGLCSTPFAVILVTDKLGHP